MVDVFLFLGRRRALVFSEGCMRVSVGSSMPRISRVSPKPTGQNHHHHHQPERLQPSPHDLDAPPQSAHHELREASTRSREIASEMSVPLSLGRVRHALSPCPENTPKIPVYALLSTVDRFSRALPVHVSRAFPACVVLQASGWRTCVLVSTMIVASHFFFGFAQLSGENFPRNLCPPAAESPA
eukprot:6191340-Pleurochrysis_carterae.AAC.3